MYSNSDFEILRFNSSNNNDELSEAVENKTI